MRQGKEILFEDYTEDEILALPKEQVGAMILTCETVVMRAFGWRLRHLTSLPLL